MLHVTHSRAPTTRDHTSGGCDSACPGGPLTGPPVESMIVLHSRKKILTLPANYTLNDSGSPVKFWLLSQSASMPNQSEESNTQHNSDIRPPNSDMREAVTTLFSAKGPHNKCSYKPESSQVRKNPVGISLYAQEWAKSVQV